jgi:putative ABC transport system permease protein
MTSNLPLAAERQEGKLTFTIEGQSADEQQRNPFANDLRVSPNYFSAMGIRLMAGRFLNEADNAQTDRCAVISQRFAERMFPHQNPVGKRLKTGAVTSESKWATIVGVVGNVKHEAIASDGGFDWYTSYQQVGDANMYLLLRTKVPPETLTAAATQAVWTGDPEQSTFNIVTMDERIADTVWQRRLAGTLFLIFAALALVLAAIGIYGVMAYTVGQRTREIGIRLALGAQPREVLRMIVGQGAKLIAIGLGIGLGIALVGGRVIKNLLYDISSADPLIYLLVLVVLASAALLACWLPARRATRIDPLHALRQE